MHPERQQSGKLILTGKLKLESPLRIGSEEFDTWTDQPVLRDVKGRPYIPGTSLCGVLTHYCNENGDNDFSEEAKEWFWGSVREKDNKTNRNQKLFVQSALIISDACLAENGPDQCRVMIRDGVKITSQGIAEDSGKYDYEVVEPGAIFIFQAEVTLFHKYSEEFIKLVSFIINSLQKSQIVIGALTTKGLGRCRLEEVICWKYDFLDKRDVWNWLAGVKENRQKINLTTNVPLKTKINFKLIASFDIQNSLLIKSNFGESDTDAAHIKSNHCNIIPGTSWKGALRSRMRRILNTLGFSKIDTKIKLDNLCGAGEEKTDLKQKSRLILEETEIQHITEEQQTRIKIDRFTGGTINSALYTAEPVWPQAEKAVRVELKAGIKNCQAWEAGLLLLALKDLWSGDLALGGEKGIGRGILKGMKAEIDFREANEEKKYILTESGDGLKITGEAQEMEEWVQALLRECSRGYNHECN